MKRILITGVTGFLGTCLVNYFNGKGGLILYGHSRNPARARAAFKSHSITILDRCDLETLEENGISEIVHLAGIAHDLDGLLDAGCYEKVNFNGTAELFDSFVTSRAEKFFFVSSIKAVADASAAPLAEEATPSPASIYGRSKHKAERYIQDHPLGAQKKYYILRPCMIHGPGNKGNLALLSNFVKKGMPYPLGAYENQRSFLSAENFCFIMERLIQGNLESGIYHLSDTGTISTRELVEIVAKAHGKRGAIWHVPRSLVSIAAATGSLFRLPFNRDRLAKLTGDFIVSNNKIRTAIGELPVDLRTGIRNTISAQR